MKQQPNPLRRAAGLLLAAAALPFTPLAAQEAQPTQPVEDVTPADTETTPPAETSTTPPAETVTTPDPVPTTTATAQPEAPARTTTTRTRTTRTTTARAPAAPVRAPAAPAPTALPAPIAEAPAEILAAPAEVLPETPPAPAPVPVAQVEEDRGSMMPWVLGGLLLLGALAFFALRRRRSVEVYDDRVEQSYVEPEPALAAEPIAAVPVAAAAPVAAQPVGEPAVELRMEPIRAGVAGDDARVDFRLTVGNSGSGTAEDVRVSTWMLTGGASEMESSLIEPHPEGELPPLTLAAGQAQTIETSVALPTAQVDGDAVLPVVVADARYRLADGTEARTSCSFAVGVPVGDDLAHFDVENPSGLHEDVEARPLG